MTIILDYAKEKEEELLTGDYREQILESFVINREISYENIMREVIEQPRSINELIQQNWGKF